MTPRRRDSPSARFLAGLALAMLPLACASRQPAAGFDLAGASLVDLTHGFDRDTVYWPTADPFKLEVVSEGDTEAGFYYSANRFSAAEHGGTHLDSPIHFYRARQTVDQIPLATLMGEAVCVDVSAACAADRDHEITVAELEAWEREHGLIAPGSIVLLRTGFGAYWGDAERYMGTAERGPEAVAKLSFPGLHHDAALWLAERRKVKLVGIDTPSIDRGRSRTFMSHVLLFRANVPALENVANLDLLPPRGFAVIALPMKIIHGSGAPTRIVAVVPPRR